MGFRHILIFIAAAVVLATTSSAQLMPRRTAMLDDDPVQAAQNLVKRASQFQRAIDLLLPVVDRDPANGAAWFWLASAYHGQRDWTPAIEAYGKAAELREQRAVALYNMAQAQAMNGNKVTALETLDRASKAGFRKSDDAKVCPDLALLFGDPRFEAWIDSLSTRDELEGPTAGPGDDTAFVDPDIGKSLDESVTGAGATPDFAFSGSVIVVRGGKVLLQKGYGLADRSQGAAMSARSLFPIGAITRTFTAALILRLEQKGALRVDDPISKYIPDAPAATRAITIGQLLSHSSGFGDSWVPTTPQKLKPILSATREEVEHAILNSDIEFGAGAKSQEARSNYVLLAAIVERITHSTFEEAMRTHVLAHAKLESVRFIGENLEGPIALGYGSPDLPESIAQWPATPWIRKGSEGLVCSASDLADWVRALQGNDVLDEVERNLMFTGHAASTRLMRPYGDEGYGWAIGVNFGNTPVRGTWSDDARGFAGSITWYPTQETFVLVHSNSMSASAARDAVRRALGLVLFPRTSPGAPSRPSGIR